MSDDIFRVAQQLAEQVIACVMVQKYAVELTRDHVDGCPCVLCRAAGGDEDAMIEVIEML